MTSFLEIIKVIRLSAVDKFTTVVTRRRSAEGVDFDLGRIISFFSSDFDLPSSFNSKFFYKNSKWRPNSRKSD